MLICKPGQIRSTPSQPAAVILGINPNGVDMEYSLTRHNISTYLLEFKHTSEDMTEEVINSDADILLAWLMDFAEKRSSVTPIPSSDRFVLLLSLIKPRLDARFKLLLPDLNITQTCIDKFKLFGFCRTNGVKTPETHVIKQEPDTDKLDSDFFPCVVKPYDNHKIPEHILNKIRAVDSLTDLRNLASQILKYDNRFIVQKKIDGESHDRFFVGGLVAEDPKYNALFIGRKIREIPSFGGTTTRCVLEWNDLIHTHFKQFVDITNYLGLVDFEMMFDKTDNEFKLLEVNPRIGAWHLVSMSRQTNIIHYYYALLNGKAIDNYSPHVEGKTFIRPHTHFCSLTEEKPLFSSLFAFFKDLARSSVIAGVYFSKPAITLKSVRTFLGCIKLRIFSVYGRK